jgi:hypothetical protein
MAGGRNVTRVPLRMTSVIAGPTITIEHLPKTTDREDYLVRVTDPQNNYRFRLSLTGFTLALWGDVDDPDEAAELLVDRLVYSHGTASGFAEEGYWFDAQNSGPTLEETLHIIENQGSRFFDHPSIKTALGSQLFGVLDELDALRMDFEQEPFLRSLDVLFERSQAGDDFESEARDHAHFIYRVCLTSAILDRFNFSSSTGSLIGLSTWLRGRLSSDAADTLTQPFFMIKKLRKQYPIHEEYEVNAVGVRARRNQLEQAEAYFGLRGDPASDWHSVRTRFVRALQELRDTLGRSRE